MPDHLLLPVQKIKVKDSVFGNWANVCLVCLSSQRLHHVPLLNTKRERLPESSVGVSGRGFLPVFTRAGFQVGLGSRVKPEGSCDAASGFILDFDLFRQEGWRLENENPSDADTPLIFKGVVFNEMKGAFVSHPFVLKLRSFHVGIVILFL